MSHIFLSFFFARHLYEPNLCAIPSPHPGSIPGSPVRCKCKANHLWHPRDNEDQAGKPSNVNGAAGKHVICQQANSECKAGRICGPETSRTDRANKATSQCQAQPKLQSGGCTGESRDANGETRAGQLPLPSAHRPKRHTARQTSSLGFVLVGTSKPFRQIATASPVQPCQRPGQR